MLIARLAHCPAREEACVCLRRAGRHGRDRNRRPDRHYSVGGHGNRSDGIVAGGRLNIRKEEAGGFAFCRYRRRKLKVDFEQHHRRVEEGQRELFDISYRTAATYSPDPSSAGGFVRRAGCQHD